MRNRLVIFVAGMLAAFGLVAATTTASASSQDQTTGNVAFGVVRLNGAQEIGPNGEVGVGDPDGRGKFAFVAFDSKLCYVLTARKIDPAAAAHIHAGAKGVNGGIVVGLTAPTEGFSFDCIDAVPDTTENTPEVLTQSELDTIIADPAGFYANVHNATFPAGAIRGQLR